MDNRWAVIIAVVAVGGIAWWYSGHPGYETLEQRQARIEALEESRGGHPVYRWVDDKGVTQFTDAPPPDRKYTEVRIREDQNVVTLPQAAETPEQKRARERRKNR
jgi:hypothetical protein